MALTALPPAPSRSDPAPTFITKADAFVAALPNLVTEINAALLAISAGSVADGGITTAKLANLAVTTGKLALLAVTAAQLADNAVTTAKIADGQVTPNKLASSAVTTDKIAAANVTAAKLASGAALANLGFTPVNKAGDTVTGPLSFAGAVSVNSTASFTSSMPTGPNGTPLGYQRLTPHYYTADAWVEMGSCGGVQYAKAGCTAFVCTKPATQAGMFDGFSCAIVNGTGGAISINQEDAGVPLCWINASGVQVTGSRTMANGGTASISYLNGLWILAGAGIA